MIVICTKCQAKFRVADDKIGDRGAKVRCSKCQTVFLVRPEPPAPAPPRAIPPPLPPPLPSVRAAAAFDASSFAPSAPARDPFAAPAEPFPPPQASDPFAWPAPGPFASPAPDPFAPPGAGGAPPTDLADLLGAAASAAPPPAAADADDGLALEERSATPPRPASSAPFDQGLEAGYEAFAGAGDVQAFDPGAIDLGGAAELSPLVSGPLVTGALDLADPASRAQDPAAANGAPRLSRPRDAAAAGAPSTAHAPERIPGRPSRLRSVAVNAIALAALLAAAVAILALWRSEGRVGADALRPSAVLAALRSGAGDGQFAVREVRSGLYEREKAPPVLFVRGSVVSRAPAPVGRIRVRVEILRGGAVVATGEALAGAVPTPEELWAARDAAALAAAATRAARRAPAEVRPGDAVPFLVAIADHPADLGGASLRVEAGAQESAAR